MSLDRYREVRKIIRESGGKHPPSSTVVKGGRGLQRVEQEYKLNKIKVVDKL